MLSAVAMMWQVVAMFHVGALDTLILLRAQIIAVLSFGWQVSNYRTPKEFEVYKSPHAKSRFYHDPGMGFYH